jgi:ABC-2 type transport system ATP-binding protein
VRLAPGGDAQQLLERAASKARLSKFEIMEPSLEEIFLEVVGKSNG